MKCINISKGIGKKLENIHGGSGRAEGTRLLFNDDFSASTFDFVDFVWLYPGTSIGRHTHSGNDELYFFTKGQGRMFVNDKKLKVKAGDIVLVTSGESHSTLNTGSKKLGIFVIQVSHGARKEKVESSYTCKGFKRLLDKWEKYGKDPR